MTQGVINLIPKPQKDHSQLENWRPISLLNNDYKILAMIFAKKIKCVLNDIIDECQSGFMTDRLISNNIRLVLDILDYSDLIPDDSLLLFLDFYKAFDSIEFPFILKSLSSFGFGPNFINAIQILYNNANASIKLQHGTTHRFNVERGIRQGCPISPYLFLLPMQLLAIHIQNSNLKSISVANRSILISQLADDTTLFLKNKDQVPLALDKIKFFSSASGLCLNIHKCELLSIKDSIDVKICDIPVKSEVKYLGIIICKDQKKRSKLNFEPLILSIRRKLNSWLQRDLSITGRVLLSKADGLTRVIYPAMVLDVSVETCRTLDKIIVDFVWNAKTHLIKKSVMLADRAMGGFELVDFSTLNNSFKIKWIKTFLNNPTSCWNFIPNHIFNSVGGLNFLLRCNFDISKMPLSLSNFHKQALISWSLIHDYNFSPHSYFIWNNKNIRYKNKSLFFHNWFDKNILLVSQLLDDRGVLFTYEQFMQAFSFPVPPREYATVFGAIPDCIIPLVKCGPKGCLDALLFDNTNLFVDQRLLNTMSNKDIRSIINRSQISLPACVSFWNNVFSDIEWEEFWLLRQKFFLFNKVVEVSIKIIHNCYPVNYKLAKFNNSISPNCSFCFQSEETINHLFWDCVYCKVFWVDFSNFVKKYLYPNFCITPKILFFGYSLNLDPSHCKFIINLLLFLAKFYIHKCKFSKKTPYFFIFRKDFDVYVNSLRNSNNSIACKTLSWCKSYKLT